MLPWPVLLWLLCHDALRTLEHGLRCIETGKDDYQARPDSCTVHTRKFLGLLRSHSASAVVTYSIRSAILPLDAFDDWITLLQVAPPESI